MLIGTGFLHIKWTGVAWLDHAKTDSFSVVLCLLHHGQPNVTNPAKLNFPWGGGSNVTKKCMQTGDTFCAKSPHNPV